MSATVDLRPVGSIELAGVRVGRDLRWLGYAATTASSANSVRRGSATRPGRSRPARAGQPVDAAVVDADTVDVQALAVALTPGLSGDRRRPRRRGHRGRAGAALPGRGRRPHLRGGVPADRVAGRRRDLHRWRGQLDYWVFLDDQLGQVAGSINGEAAESSRMRSTAPSRSA